MQKLTESKLFMWRACMTIFHLDGKITPAEQKWAEEKINSLPISREEKDILRADFKSPPALKSLIPKITHPPDKAFLLHMVNVLGHLDGEFHESEKQLFSSLQNEIMGCLDMSAIERDVQKMEADSYDKKAVFAINNRSSLFEHVYKNARLNLNLGDKKLPK
ncbi:MAG: TerB family tellurite resistance protein [Bdellovibrio sp.]|nr:TerB family tellurite resistance protein [Bdellovibrio sp.]